MIELCLTAFLVIQDPAGTPPKLEEAKPVEAAFTEWDDRTARDAVKAFGKRMRGRSLSLRDRMEAVEALAAGRNARLVEPLAKVVKVEKAITVRKAAADALGHQPEKETRRAIFVLLADNELHDVPQVQASLVNALSKAGYERGRDWEHLDGLFERSFEPERIPLQQAILRLVATHEEFDALDLLVDNLGEPVPADVHDPSNPPAEYWEARWKAWSSWRGEVKDALLRITGQRFSTAEEARVWIKKNEAELRRRKSDRG